MLKAHASVTLVAELMFVLSQQRTTYDHSNLAAAIASR